MNVCPQCARSFRPDSFRNPQGRCLHCGADVVSGGVGNWMDVARVTNLAEAGFLTDELVGRDLDARIYQLEEFSALTDRWATVYFIRVPSEHAPSAAAWIRQQLEDDSREGEGEPNELRFSVGEESIDPAFWRPVVLVVLAGVASFVLGQQFSDQQGRRLPLRNLPIDQPLETEPVPGQPRHRLVFDRQRVAWYLDSDRDGDGIYDTRQQFHASGAAW